MSGSLNAACITIKKRSIQFERTRELLDTVSNDVLVSMGSGGSVHVSCSKSSSFSSQTSRSGSDSEANSGLSKIKHG